MRSTRLRLARPFALPLALAALAALAAASPAATTPSPPHRVLLVSIDGMMPEAYTDPDSLALSVPNLRKLVKASAYARAVFGVLPTNTYPSHTTLATGLPPREHGVLGNRIFDPFRKSNEAWYWYAAEIRAPTLWSAAEAKGLRVGAILWPVTVGARIDALVPEIWRSGSSSPDDLKLLRALSTPGLVEAVEKRLGRELTWPPSDADRTELALEILRTRKPELLMVHLAELDHFEHEDGPGSQQAKAALERDDADLGRLLAALDELGLRDQTLVAVVSDHGFLPTRTALAPNTLLTRARLIDLDRAGNVLGWRAMFWYQGGTALLRLADPHDRASLDHVRSLITQKMNEPRSGIRRILEAGEIARLGGDPAVTPLALDAETGSSFIGDVVGPWRRPAHDLGNHGFAPDRPEMAAALILAGPGVSKTGDLGIVPMTAIAPTVARWLGVELDPRAGPGRDWLTPTPVSAPP